MNDTVYRKLAEYLDSIPNGFPATQSGVEIKLLAKLFTPEQAALALDLKLIPEYPEQVASRTGRDPEQTAALLEEMSQRGLIRTKQAKDRTLYGLVPYVVGIFELQLEHMDEEFARLNEQYYREAFHNLLNMKPAIQRVVPIDQSIPLDIEVAHYERATTILADAASWGVLDCICRKQNQMLGQACSHPIDVCMIFSKRPNMFDDSSYIKALTREEALGVLRRAAEAGLVHTVRNAQKGTFYLCNCCTCGCSILRGVTEYGFLSAVAPSRFRVQVEEDACTGCELCVDRCQFHALSVSDGLCHVDERLCFGCGVCTMSCMDSALSLKPRPEQEVSQPPLSEYDWMMERAEARGLEQARLERVIGRYLEEKNA
ncbi:MAG: 4Fe-4S binding protein [Dehalococcoidia bacterium]|nr:4Fe-4S binding protein [Dehalococcoidia bacterium]